MSMYSPFIFASFDHFVSPAKFYMIPKIYKTSMVGRPIAASHLYITICEQALFWDSCDERGAR